MTVPRRIAPSAAFGADRCHAWRQNRRGLKLTRALRNFTGGHVGEDSGWHLIGLPVHSIGDGVVAMVMHDLSWGVLVAVEHRVDDGAPITAYYGHLGREVDVEPGQRVRMGDKIGEIGPSLSQENGGYFAHVHLGIEKAEFEAANILGYDDEVERYHDPVRFVQRRLR